MKITPKPIPQTFTDLIDKMPLDQIQLFPLDCVSGIRSAIYRLKQRTGKRFTTKKDRSLIEVKRIK